MLPLVGIALPASKLMPEAVAHELKPDKRYLIQVKHGMPMESLERCTEQLRRAGFKNFMITDMDCDIFDVSD